jgi:hypothetical protein
VNLFPKIQPAPPCDGPDIVTLVLTTLRRDGVIAPAPADGPVVQRLPADDSEGGLA